MTTPTPTPDSPATTLTIRRALPAELATVTDVITEAFLPLEPSEWLIPDPDTRALLMPSYFGIFANHAGHHGLVDIAVDPSHPREIVGATLWWRSNVAVADYEILRAAALHTGDHLPRFRTFDRLMDMHHSSSPHLYLGFAAVRPERQGQGIGRRLLKYRLRDLDRRNEEAFLIAGSEDAARLYRQLGFKDRTPYQLPDGGPWMRPQSRRPQGGQS